MSQLVEKNQRFGTLDLAIIVTLLLIVAGISQAIVGEVCTDHRRLEARMKAESLAFRLAARDSAAARGPASVADVMAEPSPELQGLIGEDPWGHPYHYAMKKDERGKVSEVSVWSGGQEIHYVYTAPLQSRNRLVPAVSN